MRIGLAQINPTVGDIAGNARRIRAAYDELSGRGAQLVLTPELALPGYPPQDLLFKRAFLPAVEAALDELRGAVGEAPLVLGSVAANGESAGKPFRNVAAVIERGRPPRLVGKTLLPTYDVFDEERYFESATEWPVIALCGRRVGITICEDIWPADELPRPLYRIDPVERLVANGAEVILNLSASPFHSGKPRARQRMVERVARRHRVPVVYCNAVGGNDELVFDGSSAAVASDGGRIGGCAAFAEELLVVDSAAAAAEPAAAAGAAVPEREVFSALRLGLADYFRKCGFQSAVLGLSGGIDSALSACIAVAALGADNVIGVTMPSRYSSAGSVDDSELLAANLGIVCHRIPIGEPVAAFGRLLGPYFAGRDEDTADENIQPRVRATLLMALSNKFGHLLISTGNKSEMAVGYCTLYGDMAGGLAVISDVPKTLVYQLARWLNRERETIPASIIDKPPSAELKPNQLDRDSLPPYETLDPILEMYVERHLAVDEIVAAGFPRETVDWVRRRVDLNEYKRKQAAPGIKVTSKAFGSGRRMPVAQGFVA